MAEKLPDFLSDYEEDVNGPAVQADGSPPQPDKLPDFLSEYTDDIHPNQPPSNPEGEFNPPSDKDSGFIENYGKKTIANAGALTSFNQDERLKIYKSHYPKLEERKDAEGNILLNSRAYTGEDKWEYLNEPGVSGADVFPALLGGLSMIPATKGAQALGKSIPGVARRIAPGLTPSLTGNIARGAGMAATAQAGIEGVQLAAGGEANPGEVALATVGSIAGDLVFNTITRGFGLSLAMKSKVKGHLDELRKRYGTRTAANIQKAQQNTEEFGIPYSRGQASKDPELLQLEAAYAKGSGNTSEQVTMLDFLENQQDPQAKAATKKILNKYGDESLKTGPEVGAVIGEEVAGKASDKWEAIFQSFEKVRQSGDAHLSGEKSADIMKTIQGIAKRNNFEVSIEWPSTRRAIEIVSEAEKAMKEKPLVSLAKLNSLRKRLDKNKNAARNAEDKKQVLDIMGVFDKKIRKADLRGLFSGEKRALTLLREANSLRREYGDLFSPRSGLTRGSNKISDGAGKFIENLAELNPTGKEVIDGIFSANSMYKKGGDKVISRLKNIVEPETFENLKKVGLIKLFGDRAEGTLPSAAVFSSKLSHAMRDAKPMMLEFYGQEGVDMLHRFGKALRRSQPKVRVDRLNPSGTAAQLAVVLKKQGFRNSGTAGFIISVLGDMVAGGKAITTVKAFRPFENISKGLSGAVGSTAARASANELQE